MKRKFKRIACIGVLLIFFFNLFITNVFAYSQAQFINNGSQYYLKNNRSGKYLDIANGVDANGTNVLQWQYNGNSNQRWNMLYDSNLGVYKINPNCSLTRFLDVYPANDLLRGNIDIWTDSNNNDARKFAIVKNSDGYSYRILSKCSNYIRAVTVEGASCDNGANVFQFSYNGSKNDEWIFQPTSKRASMGVNYAVKNYKNFPMAYPNLDLGDDFGDCTNFVSECMLASGIAYRNEWYINKKNERYLEPITITQLDYSWDLQSLGYGYGSPWVSAPAFMNYWSNKVSNETYTGQEFLCKTSDNIVRRVSNETYTGQEIINNPSYILSRSFTSGDVIQILDSNSNAKHTMYITEFNRSTYQNVTSYAVTAHSGSVLNKNLLDIISGNSSYNTCKFRFYKMI